MNSPSFDWKKTPQLSIPQVLGNQDPQDIPLGVVLMIIG